MHDQATFCGTERCHHEIVIPDPKRLPGVETLSQYEAVRLFIERARAAKADFAVTTVRRGWSQDVLARPDAPPISAVLGLL
ncbi:MAG TPA: hypothetical protein VFQ09_00770 [Rubrobacter sp.]|nr:hypothetical protein [Rubrobacter sp.]HEX5700808.1 hypothetical protein [Rubrobacter sp.]